MPVVTIAPDGRSARLRNGEVGMTGRHRGETLWSATVQEVELARGADGLGRIASLRRVPRMHAAYAEGWSAPGAIHAEAAPRLEASRTVFSPPSFAGAGDAATLVAQAEAFDGSENVSNAYGYYIDEFDWDGTADLFSTDGWKELSYIG